MSIRRTAFKVISPLQTTSTRSLATATSTPKIHVGLLLKRNPVILRDLTPFETSYYSYRHNLIQNEARPFNPKFYIKKGTAAEPRWHAAQEAARKEAEETGAPYFPKQPREEELKDVKLAERETEADRANDVKSLNRALQRTLYLVVKGESGWEFPATPLTGEELLHEAAQRHITSQLGEGVETWIVGQAPVGHWVEPQRKIFYMKAHIISGNGAPQSAEYAWLTKQELVSQLDPEYYKAVGGMLAEL
ncbi:54S ribosomal protein L17 mitochondrial [Rhizophlyctis rosea]|uniref:Large ribosomal subunit protein mL46 n=1 Tax=Rhizophlyctis rosea TaxID=64517 RepID=A0AAD5SDX6_9FUNG|nr:54S ribosomal protein L17 mitochondrial [Rhizophlyctis rosea]